MLVIRVELKVKPEEKTNFVEFVKGHNAESKEFEGCLWFETYRSLSQEDTFVIYEEWQSQETFDVYKNSDLFKRSMQTFGAMFAGPPNSAYYSAESLPVH